MSEMSREELLQAEAIGSEQGWVAPMSQEDKVSAPVIKCKKTPRKKCNFVAERREKR